MSKPTITPLELATIKELYGRYLLAKGAYPRHPHDMELIGLVIQNLSAFIWAAEHVTEEVT